jgi:hypothetical protein
VFDEKLPQSGMIGETTAAAITKSRADLPDVTSRDLAATQSATGVRAWGSIVDENEAKHVGTSTWTRFPRSGVITAGFADRDSRSGAAIPLIAIW